MFDGKYLDWNNKRIKGIVDFYGHKFFFYKKVADLGCGHADISGVLYRLGADITAVDAREEHLKIATKKFPGIKTLKADLDRGWPFSTKFDIVLDLDMICHLSSFEDHLKMICANTSHLIIETAVCDSDDPNKVMVLKENKSIYDLSVNGLSCRPSPAAIERVLQECGMNFKRLDQARFNSGSYVYDWVAKNNDECNINKRRMWFAIRNDNPIKFAATKQPAVLSSPGNNLGSGAVLKNSQMPILPQTVPPLPELPVAVPNDKPTLSLPTPSNYFKSSDSEAVQKNSQEFATIFPDNFIAPSTFQTGGIIFPATISSCMWFKKVAPFFPNVKVHNSVHNLQGFNTSDDYPSVIMCSINKPRHYHRIWIEEWYEQQITEDNINILSKCPVIMTPSLTNAQQILQLLPNANVIRTGRPWPILNISSEKGSHYVYLEKHPKLTTTLFNAWNPAWGNIFVVGARTKMPSFATYIPDTEDYPELLKIILGAKAIIDLSVNTYYMSGILDLAKIAGVPIITNNYYQSDENLVTCILQDKIAGASPTSDDINKAMVKFLEKSTNNQSTFNNSLNNDLDTCMKKMLGV